MEDQTKRCCRCREMLQLEYFNKSRRNHDGCHNHCRGCQKIIRHQWYLKNKKHEAEKSRIYQKTDFAKKSQKIYYEQNKEKILERSRVRRRKEPALIKQRLNEGKRRRENIQHRLAKSLRSRVHCAVKRQNKHKQDRTKVLCGCEFDFLVKYIEDRFLENMSWSNYGVHGWHIDHIVPCSSFDLTKLEEQMKCFHYSNLQPLWAEDNIRKSNRIL